VTTQARVAELIAAELDRGGHPNEDRLIYAVLDESTDRDIVRWAKRWLAKQLWDAYRERQKKVEKRLSIERAAAERREGIPPRPDPNGPPPKYGYWSWTPEEQAAYREQWKRDEAAHQERMREIDREMWAALKKATDDYRDAITLEVTEELLGAYFALPDGTHVTWRDATVEQHRERIHMLQRHAKSELESAGRHEKAIQIITSARVRTLGDVREVAA